MIPFAISSSAQRHYAILFGSRESSTPAPEELSAEEIAQCRRLERELSETKEYLNAIIDREQAANEELKSASEEILSANEELQSTNEEMATAKEEVQATNEELVTVNDELQGRFQELNSANSDLTNLFEATNIPIVMVSEKLCVRRFTEASQKILNISNADIGKSLIDIGPKLRIDGLATLTSDVIKTLNTKDEEIKDLDGRWYSLRIRPYRTRDNRIDGAVIALRDVTKEKQIEERTTDAKDVAEAANLAKSDFLANMSHEIRTPLSAILGYSELLANPDQTKSDALRCTTRIQRNMEHLTELIDEILDISKIEAGKLEIERVRFPLLPELSEIFTLLQDRACAKGLTFDVTFEGEIPESISACPMRLRQILLNIAGNALKFTQHGGVSIAVKLGRNLPGSGNMQLCFVVQDTGCGLAPDQQDRLFRPFSQADSSVTRRYGGTGLGLVLARRLAEALGGDVQLTGSKVGEGSTFTFRLDPGALEGIPMLKGVTKTDLKVSKHAPQDLFIPNKKLQDLRILLVEDGADNQILMAHVLETSGARVASAVNGAEALKMASENQYDLVLMDMQMPILDGYEATKQLLAKGYSTPIVALTANAMRGERETCLAAGCVEYISKPVKANVLVDTVAKFAKKKDLTFPEVSQRSELYDDPIVGPLVGQFVQNLPKRVAALRDAERRADWPAISNLAHQLAGSSGGYGFSEMGKEAARIEAYAKNRVNTQVLAKSIARFGSLCDAAVRGNLTEH